MPLFSRGSSMANLSVANLRKDIAVADYEKTIQTTFRDVSDALDATDTLRREALAQESADLVFQRKSEVIQRRASYRNVLIPPRYCW
ncbi:TolC family protein [Pectobacterium betavasculorum]|uniref:TolC family protein n=1 Tax=Pectobacterium betavasculorum TaxID=55207 RepID=UPI0022B024E6|nr:TolC family protein [Pectobacterium betavasculorum]